MSAWSFYETHLDGWLERWEGDVQGTFRMAYLVQIARALEACPAPKKRETAIAWRARVRPDLLLRLAQSDLREFHGDPDYSGRGQEGE